MRMRLIAAMLGTALTIAGASVWVAAQAVAVTKVPPKVMTGSDIGFRVEGLRGSIPVGTLVVKVNGEWVEAEVAVPNPRTLSTR